VEELKEATYIMNSIRIFVTRQHGFITSWPQLSFVPLDCGCELAGRLLFHGAEVDEEVSSISNSVIQALAAVYQSIVSNQHS
tara:strand:+ start:1117 stop:1362 length:246 start_codon:yes stop_codon:yes gene_type:complete